ncbi:MAG: GFA family protein [Pseudomonadota bacterium]
MIFGTKTTPVRLSGRCLCGCITFTIPVPRKFDVCHCDDCRRWHGTSPVGIDGTDVELLSGADQLRWYQGPTGAERGFCERCGSSLFYRYYPGSNRWSAYIGALVDIPPDIPLGGQHFSNEKPSNYAICAVKKFL